MPAKTPVRRHDGRIVGHVRGSELVLARRRSRHWLRSLGGWSVDRAVLAQAAALGATCVVVRDVESGTVYRAPLSAFAEYGLAVDFGHGAQVALAERHWVKGGTRQLRLEV